MEREFNTSLNTCGVRYTDIQVQSGRSKEFGKKAYKTPVLLSFLCFLLRVKFFPVILKKKLNQLTPAASHQASYALWMDIVRTKILHRVRRYSFLLKILKILCNIVTYLSKHRTGLSEGPQATPTQNSAKPELVLL